MIRFLERNGIPYHYLCTNKDGKRETVMLELVQNTDFLVLARYMQVTEVCYRFLQIYLWFQIFRGTVIVLSLELWGVDWLTTFFLSFFHLEVTRIGSLKSITVLAVCPYCNLKTENEFVLHFYSIMHILPFLLKIYA